MVGGERGVDQEVVGGGRFGDVHNDDVDNEQAEPREEVEAEEDYVACGGGVEHKGEDVHPRGDGDAVRHQQEDKAGQGVC